MAKYQNEKTGVIADLSKPQKGWKLISKSIPLKTVEDKQESIETDEEPVIKEKKKARK